jgi:beta-1,2-mannobiose phosphorylase / 1,2-beta-oligomannan phosphorylase
MTVLIYIFITVLLVVVIAVAYIAIHPSRTRRHMRHAHLTRYVGNPILTPDPSVSWKSAAVFNPAAVYTNGQVHLFYRALGGDGISRIGYALSKDGVHFENSSFPAFAMRTSSSARFKNPFASSENLRYDTSLYASGGGWGGSEDPRAVEIDGRIYMTFGVFESWDSIRIALTSIGLGDVEPKRWNWAPHFFISPQNETNKNWVMFPEKIHGKFAILHALTPDILIEYTDSLDELEKNPIHSNNKRTGRAGHWDVFVRGAAAPPIKTKYGWLLLYHGMDPTQSVGYKVGAMILDVDDPTKVLYRSAAPILEPSGLYDNDWKPGVVYASGAVVIDGTLFVYFGGGDKTVNVATAPLEQFLKALMRNGRVEISQAV